MAMDVEDYATSFRPDIIDAVSGWCQGGTFAKVLTLTDVFEVSGVHYVTLTDVFETGGVHDLTLTDVFEVDRVHSLTLTDVFEVGGVHYQLSSVLTPKLACIDLLFYASPPKRAVYDACFVSCLLCILLMTSCWQSHLPGWCGWQHGWNSLHRVQLWLRQVPGCICSQLCSSVVVQYQTWIESPNPVDVVLSDIHHLSISNTYQVAQIKSAR